MSSKILLSSREDKIHIFKPSCNFLFILRFLSRNFLLEISFPDGGQAK